MRILFAMPGLHRFDRGAEIAFIAIAGQLAESGDAVTLIGPGPSRQSVPYAYLRAPCLSRTCFESFPSLPFLRHEYAYDDLTFAPALLCRYRPADYDVTVTCGYPYTNWILRRPAFAATRPPHVFVTQNGDWPARASEADYRFFGCEGLVCTNPDYYEANRSRWNCRLIPNGVDVKQFRPGPPQRDAFGIPPDATIVLMVSALIESKRISAGIRAVGQIPGAHLVVAGDGPLRQQLNHEAAELLPGRFTCLSLPAVRMPELYHSADVLLHLSLEEAFGNVFIEALACGLPVVAHDTPRLRWIVGSEGFLLDTRNTSDLTSAIMFAASAAPANRERRVTQAAQFSWTRVGHMYRDFLFGVVASSRTPTPASKSPR